MSYALPPKQTTVSSTRKSLAPTTTTRTRRDKRAWSNAWRKSVALAFYEAPYLLVTNSFTWQENKNENQTSNSNRERYSGTGFGSRLRETTTSLRMQRQDKGTKSPWVFFSKPRVFEGFQTPFLFHRKKKTKKHTSTPTRRAFFGVHGRWKTCWYDHRVVGGSSHFYFFFWTMCVSLSFSLTFFHFCYSRFETLFLCLVCAKCVRDNITIFFFKVSLTFFSVLNLKICFKFNFQEKR